MSTIVTINSGDLISNSRADLNSNFVALNADKEEVSNKDTSTSLGTSDTKYPSQNAVKVYVDTQGGANASTTVRGIVEEATAAEVLAGTAAGATGARLFINPSTATFKTPTSQKFAGNGTYTKPSGLYYAIIEMVGGGGGGGAGINNVSGGGGSGAYGKWIILASVIGATETVTIGAAGQALSAGGTTSFGTLATAGGGAGGAANETGGAGGTIGGSAAAVFSFSNNGGSGLNDTNPTTDQDTSGQGGNSFWGQGGGVRSTASSGASGVMIGETGKGYGSGGSGSIGTNSGAAGTIGYMVVTEYYV